MVGDDERGGFGGASLGGGRVKQLPAAEKYVQLKQREVTCLRDNYSEADGMYKKSWMMSWQVHIEISVASLLVG
jgi:hypothetical protein